MERDNGEMTRPPPIMRLSKNKSNVYIVQIDKFYLSISNLLVLIDPKLRRDAAAGTTVRQCLPI